MRHDDKRPAASASLAAALEELAVRLSRLNLRHNDPEHFHVEKSEIVAELIELARRA